HSDDECGEGYECAFEAAIKGAVCAEQLKRAREEGGSGRVPIARGLPVWPAWDLGGSDSTAIWFGQTAGQEERIIGYYEASGVGLDHYATVLREKGCLYEQPFFPPDVAVKSPSTGGSSVET